MCKHRLSVDVARGIDVFDVGFKTAVGNDCAALGFNADVFKPESRYVCATTDRQQNFVGKYFFFAVFGLDDRAVCGNFFDL